MQISGLVITLNEADNIRECLQSLFRVCSDVVVVDSNSSDATVAIAGQLGAKVYQQPYLGDGAQRNYGLPFCEHDWVLNIDADERLDDDAIAAIQRLNLADGRYDAYEFRRKNLFHGKWMKYTAWYPDYVRRLFDRQKTRFSESFGHTKIESSRFKQLDSHIIHFSYVDYHDIIQRMNKYSTRYAEHKLGSDGRVNVFSPLLHGLFAFLKNYLFKRGFMGGFDGFNISLLNALGSYFKYAKLLEKQRFIASPPNLPTQEGEEQGQEGKP